MERRKLIAGNWKMNGVRADAEQFEAMIAGAQDAPADLLICPPATLIADFAARARSSRMMVGAQDCHTSASGAHTGDISATMIADAGAGAVIVGHSERRADHGESSALVRGKAAAVLGAGLLPIICVGESEAERDAGRALSVIGEQLAASLPDLAGDMVIAYEPVWAIGTGRVPSAEDIAEVHAFIRSEPAFARAQSGGSLRVLYGGSLKPGNAAQILAIDGVDGGLIGGASLKAADFLAIAAAC